MIKTDMVNACTKWEDSNVAIANGIISSGNQDDLGALVAKIIKEVEEVPRERDAALHR